MAGYAAEVGFDSCGVGPHVAAPDTGDRAHIDATTAALVLHPNHYVILEPEPPCRGGGLDATGGRISRNDLPAHLPRRRQGSCERLFG